MTVLFSDNFDTDTVGALPSGWTSVVGTWVVSTDHPTSGANDLKNTSAASFDTVLRTGTADVTTDLQQYSFRYTNGGATLGPVWRSDAGFSNAYYYNFSISPASILWFKRTGGSYGSSTSIAFTPPTFAANDLVMVERKSTGGVHELRIWNGTTGSRPSTATASFTENTYTSGYSGVSTNASSTPGFDDYYYTDGALVGAAAPTAVPANSTVPTISGTATVGNVLTANPGTWTQSPTSYTYQWSRAGTAISGATSSTYTLVSADQGNAITVAVVAINSIGSSTPATSAATSSVAAAAASGITIAPNNAAIVYSPYNWNVVAAGATTINAGAKLRTMFSGASLTLNFNVALNGTPLSEIYYRIDGYDAQAPWTKANVASTIAVAMPADTAALPYHLLEVVVKSTSETINRWNPAAMGTAVVFTGLTLASGGTVLAPMSSGGKNILAFGTSITEGVRTINQTATNDTDRNDAKMGWAYTLGDLLGVNMGIVGFGASGLTVVGSGSVPALPTSYSSIFSGQARTFSPIPDLILLEEGTNDASATASAVTAALTTVLNGLLTVCPGSKIVVMRPFNGSQAAALQAGIAACANPALVSYMDTTGFLNSAYGIDSLSLHPSGSNNLGQVAPAVANALRSILNPVSTPRFANTFH